ncbi:unnamed protein product, partial [Clonostachys solani]
SQPNVRRRRPRTAVGTTTSSAGTRPVSPQIAHSTGTTSDYQSDSPPDDWTSLFVGFSSDQDPYVLRHCRFNNDYYQRQDWACMRIYGNNDVPMHFTTVPDSHLDSDLNATLRCPPIDAGSETHKSLIRSYFDVVHTSYPILDGQHIQTTIDKYPPLTGIMYRLASPFTDVKMEETWPEWYDYLHRVLLWHSRYPRLATIELSLLILCRQNSIHRVPTLPGVWPQIGSLVGMCHELGLNMDPSRWSIPVWERSRRIRLWWAVFMADKWHALGLGRPSYIHEDQWNVPMVSERDIPPQSFEGRAVPSSTTKLFIAMSVLTTILSDLLCKAYTVRSIGTEASPDTADTLRMFNSFFHRLETFQEEHVKGLQSAADQIRDPTGTLHLAFFTVQIVLYRAILRRMPPVCPEAAQLRQGARQVTQNVIKFVECLQVSRLRAFWWSPLSRTNFSIAGSFMCNMVLTSTEDEEVNAWTNQLTRYRTLLGMHSESFDITKLAVKRLALIASVSEPETVTRQSHEASAVDHTGPTLPDISDLPMSFDQELDFLLDFAIPDELGGSYSFREN